MSNKLKITPLTANLYIPHKGESNARAQTMLLAQSFQHKQFTTFTI